METSAGTSHNGLAAKESSLLLCSALLWRMGCLRAARQVRACGKLECCVSSPETASAAAWPRVPRDNRLRVGGRSWHVAPRSCTERERPPAGAVFFVRARSYPTCAVRRAHAAQVRVLRLFLKESEHSCALASARRKSLLRRMEASAGTPDRSLAPKERGLPPVKFFLWGAERPRPARHNARA